MAYSHHITERLKALEDVRVMLDEPLAHHTTFKIGGPATALVLVDSEESLTQVVYACQKTETPFTVIGGGSNLLCPDKGYEGVVIKLGLGFAAFEVGSAGEDLDAASIVSVGAGLPLRTLVRRALESSLVGVENFAGIPGTVGGALRMNAGLWSSGIGQFVRTVTTFQPTSATFHTHVGSDIAWSYRTGVPEELGIVTSATLMFERGDVVEANEKIAEALNLRKSKQPLNLPNAGSIFKNPEGSSAGALIERCGLKGFSVGGAQVSLLHANFIVNTGGATAADVNAVIAHIIESVNLAYGILLDQEIRTLR